MKVVGAFSSLAVLACAADSCLANTTPTTFATVSQGNVRLHRRSYGKPSNSIRGEYHVPNPRNERLSQKMALNTGETMEFAKMKVYGDGRTKVLWKQDDGQPYDKNKHTLYEVHDGGGTSVAGGRRNRH